MSVESVNRALGGDRMLLLVLQEGELDDPGPDDVKRIGTVGIIRQMARNPAGIHVIVEGLARVRADVISRTGLSMRAVIHAEPEQVDRSVEVDAYVRRLQEQVDRALTLASGFSQELRGIVSAIEDPLRLAYLLGSLLDMPADEKQKLLEADTLLSKLEMVSQALAREIALLEVKGKIESQAQQEMSDAQRQYYLRQQLKAIQDELGEGEGDEIQALRARVEKANLPEAVLTVANREVDRLARMTPASPEYQMLRTYMDWLLDVPWSVTTDDRLDPVEARRVLDEDHYDLDKVKERIVEYLAVRKLKGDMKGPILCFVGPPGVGKTSLGQSIARAMNRKFVRISLGGVRDEAEIRGHRRTYIGSMPGRVVQALRQAGAANPVFMLDEMDKVSVGFQGDPAAALLEVLDPAQNNSFRDHYLEVPFDLSRTLVHRDGQPAGNAAPGAARSHGGDPAHGVQRGGEDPHRAAVSDPAAGERARAEARESGASPTPRCTGSSSEYTREAGVRNLERQIGSIARKVAARVASRTPEEGEAPTQTVDADSVPEYLGPPRIHQEVSFRTSRPGVATGVAWTETGGDVLFIEATLLPGGNSQIILTGQLGNVMQESARAAVSHIRAQASALGISPSFLDKHDLHVHVPAGAIPKDGPSAGVTIATAILSALRNEAVKEEVAMTGEITLTGLVLPVGGIREKALAARRYGIRVFVLPALNLPDVDELPQEVKREMRFVPAQTLDDVLKEALPTPVPVT